MNETLRIICAQLGARDHYAFPRAFHQAGLLDTLVTDFWSANLFLPRMLQPKRVRGRYHEGLQNARVKDAGVRTLAKEMGFRLRGMEGWARTLSRNSFFQSTAEAAIPWSESHNSTDSGEQSPVLFAYSYAALGLLSRAKSLGWTTVLGQIDPGPLEAQVVAAEAKAWPQFGPPRNEAPEEYWENWRKEIALADFIVVNSQWSKSTLSKAGVPEQKLHVIPIPFEEVEISRYRARNYPDRFTSTRPLRALFLGQINHRKGVPALLAAVNALKDFPIELWMVGSEELNIPNEFRAHPQIRWFGKIRRNAVNEFYQRADVFLFPTHSDGFGLTQLEAQAHKLPVIASRNCGQVVIAHKNGILLENVTPAALAGALIECCENPSQLSQWSENSRVDPAFSLSSVSARVSAMLAGKMSKEV